MLTLKTSVAAGILAAAALASAGATYFSVTANMQTTVSASCPAAPSTSTITARGIPLGGPPLPTNQGTKW